MRQFVRTVLGAAILAVIGGLLGCGGGSSSPTNPIATPVISSITPQSGSANTSVTIRGSNFGPLQGTSTVTYDGVTTGVTSWSNTVIVATVPAGALTGGTFVVSVNGFLSNPSTPFTVAGAAFSGLSPTSGIPGSQVTITGSGFGATQGSSSSSYVVFNGQTAPITYWSDTNIICKVPTGLQSGGVTVVVVVGGKQSNYQTFNVLLPQINSMVYADGDGENPGGTVTVSGQGFGTTNSTPNTYVAIDGKTVSTLAWGDTSISVVLPNSGLTAGYHSIVVVVNGQSSNSSSVRVAAPAISGQSPTPFDYDKTAILSGKFFGTTQSEGNGTIQVEGISGTIIPLTWSDTAISFKWPVNNATWGQQTKTVTITVGGISGSFSATAY
ncbi:MAG: hypothetical protein GX442_15135 [Candidatus Riflebacteria bacterium]|nr:hypothetical protein [Candidatus Riflebacteria bacterium]